MQIIIMESCFNISITFTNVSVTIPIVRISIVDYITIDKTFVFILLQLLMANNFYRKKKL